MIHVFSLALVSTLFLSSSLGFAFPLDSSLKSRGGCSNRNSQFQDIEEMGNLFHDIALITKENRRPRTKADAKAFAPLSLESYQGRFWCQVKGTPPKPGHIPTQAELDEQYAGQNATVAFENDIVMVNRHAINDETLPVNPKPENCFFEHLASKKFYRATSKVSYKPFKMQDGKVIDSQEEDIALIRLSKPIQGVSPIKESDMLIDTPLKPTTPLIVVSNYAGNAPNGNLKAKTIAGCTFQNSLVNSMHTESNVISTDCNTGSGSSAAQVYVNQGGVPKLFGIVRGGRVMNGVQEGSGYQLGILDTGVIRFTNGLRELYRDLPQ